MFQGERPCQEECFRPAIARRFQFRHPFVAQMRRFCAIRGTRAYFQLICCNLDRTDKKRTCSAHLGNIWMPEMESLGDLRSKTLCPTCLFGWSSAVTRLLATLQSEKGRELSVTSLKERVVRNNHENRGTSSESSPVHRGTFRPLYSAGQ